MTDWAINATFYTDSSCAVANGKESSFSAEEFVTSIGGSTSCSSSKLLDYNIKLVCVDGTLKTVYYEASDELCASHPIAVGTRKQCMSIASLGLGDYVLPTCVEASSIPGGDIPSLARDESDTVLIIEYYDNAADSTTCSEEDQTGVVETFGVPQEGAGAI